MSEKPKPVMAGAPPYRVSFAYCLPPLVPGIFQMSRPTFLSTFGDADELVHAGVAEDAVEDEGRRQGVVEAAGDELGRGFALAGGAECGAAQIAERILAFHRSIHAAVLAPGSELLVDVVVHLGVVLVAVEPQHAADAVIAAEVQRVGCRDLVGQRHVLVDIREDRVDPVRRNDVVRRTACARRCWPAAR